MAVFGAICEDWAVTPGLVDERSHGLAIELETGRQHPGLTAHPGCPVEQHALANPVPVSLFAHIVNRCPGRLKGSDDYRLFTQRQIYHPFDGHGKISDIEMQDKTVPVHHPLRPTFFLIKESSSSALRGA